MDPVNRRPPPGASPPAAEAAAAIPRRPGPGGSQGRGRPDKPGPNFGPEPGGEIPSSDCRPWAGGSPQPERRRAGAIVCVSLPAAAPARRLPRPRRRAAMMGSNCCCPPNGDNKGHPGPPHLPTPCPEHPPPPPPPAPAPRPINRRSRPASPILPHGEARGPGGPFPRPPRTPLLRGKAGGRLFRRPSVPAPAPNPPPAAPRLTWRWVREERGRGRGRRGGGCPAARPPPPLAGFDTHTHQHGGGRWGGEMVEEAEPAAARTAPRRGPDSGRGEARGRGVRRPWRALLPLLDLRTAGAASSTARAAALPAEEGWGQAPVRSEAGSAAGQAPSRGRFAASDGEAAGSALLAEPCRAGGSGDPTRDQKTRPRCGLAGPGAAPIASGSALPPSTKDTSAKQQRLELGDALGRRNGAPGVPQWATRRGARRSRAVWVGWSARPSPLGRMTKALSGIAGWRRVVVSLWFSLNIFVPVVKKRDNLRKRDVAAGEAVGVGAGQGEAGGQDSARITAGSGQRYRSFKTKFPRNLALLKHNKTKETGSKIQIIRYCFSSERKVRPRAANLRPSPCSCGGSSKIATESRFKRRRNSDCGETRGKQRYKQLV